MKLKYFLTTATAMGLLMGAAAAGNNNKSLVIQNGNANSASVNQAGDGNTAGNTNYGPNDWSLRQDGSNNTMTVDQIGNGNNLGTNNTFQGLGLMGAKQSGDRNALDVDQTSGAAQYSGNEIGIVKQVSGAGAAATTNEIAITQTGSGRSTRGNHQVGYLNQNHGGGAKNAINITQTGGGFQLGNRIGYRASNNYAPPAYVVRQNGSDNGITTTQAGARNKIGFVTQDGDGNRASLSQDNTAALAALGSDPHPSNNAATYNSLGNLIENVDQDGAGNAATVGQLGNRNRVDLVQQNATGIVGNTAELTFDGNGNGQAGLGLLGNDFAYSAASVYDRSVVQRGAQNTVDFDVLGSFNQFGFHQDGERNTTGNVQLNGSNNEVGVNQNGTDNTVGLQTVIGNSNDIGIAQTGTGNRAFIGMSDTTTPTDSNLNAVRVRQTAVLGGSISTNLATISIDGNTNLVDVLQDGDNNATVTIDKGDSNQIEVTQGTSPLLGIDNQAAITVNGSSNVLDLTQDGTNTATIDINGSSNNAVSAGSFDTAFFGTGLTPGQITQRDGLTTRNTIDLDVGAAGASSSNLFAFNQDGNGNGIVGDIDGGSNQAYVAQVGNGNTASFVQNGGANFMKVQQ